MTRLPSSDHMIFFVFTIIKHTKLLFKNQLPSIKIRLIMCFFCLADLIGSTVFAYSTADYNPDRSYTNYCQNKRLERERLINYAPYIQIKPPLHHLPVSRCFSLEENLFYVSIEVAQNRMGRTEVWYKEVTNNKRDKFYKICTEARNGYNFIYANVETCISEKLKFTLSSFENNSVPEDKNYINQRNMLAKNITENCNSAFRHQYYDLSKKYKFPLAYNDKKVNSFPSWFINGSLKDEKSIEELQSRHSSDIVKLALHGACPGQTIFWVDG